MGKSNKKSSSSTSTSTTKVASLAVTIPPLEHADQKVCLNINVYINNIGTTNKKKRRIEIKAETTAAKKLLVSVEKKAPTAKKSKRKHKSSNGDDSSSEDISAEDQKAETTTATAKKLFVSAKKSAKRSKKKQKSSDDDSSSEDQKDMELGHDDVPFEVFERIILPKFLPEGSKTLYATNLLPPSDRDLEKADFDEFFREDGKVVNVEIKYHKNGFVDYAKIEFESHDAAKKALEDSDGRMFMTTCMILDISPHPEVPINRDYTRKVMYVCGFGKTMEGYELRDNLEDYFSSCGEIMGVCTPESKKGSLSKGYAFIQFKDFESIPKALEKDGTQFMGRPLQVRRAKVIVST